MTPTFVGGDTNSNNILDIGEVWTYTATRTVTPGQYTNTGRVTASFGQTQVSDEDPSHHFGANAVINVENAQTVLTTTRPRACFWRSAPP